MPKRIEFIGASGVGKSMLYKHLIQHNFERKRWETPHEARIRICRSIRGKKMDAKRKLALGLIKLGVEGSISRKCVKLILSSYRKDVFDQSLKLYNPLFDIKFLSLSKSSIPPYIKFRSAELYLKRVYWDVAILDHFNCTEIVVYDDGIIHNNSGVCDVKQYSETLTKYPGSEEKANPIAIVYCKLSVQENYMRRFNRIQSGKGTFIERSIQEDKLYAECEKSTINAEKKVETMRAYGISILEIDMKESIQNNSERVNYFIQSEVRS